MELISIIIESNRKRERKIAEIGAYYAKKSAEINAESKRNQQMYESAKAEMNAAFADPNMSGEDIIKLCKKNLALLPG